MSSQNRSSASLFVYQRHRHKNCRPPPPSLFPRLARLPPPGGWTGLKLYGCTRRYVVAPTVTMLAVMKARLTGATKGHALLKKKADALTMRFRYDANPSAVTRCLSSSEVKGRSLKHCLMLAACRLTTKVVLINASCAYILDGS